MTRFAPGSVQNTPNHLAKRGSCCCCCSLRTGVIILGILLLVKGVILSVQWYEYCEYAASTYNSYDYGYENEGDDVISIDGDGRGEHDHDGHQGGEYSQSGQGQGQGGQGGEMGPQQGGEGEGEQPQQGPGGQGQGQGGPPTETEVFEEEEEDDDTEVMQPYNGDSDSGERGSGGRDHDHGSADIGVVEVDEEEEEEIDIPVWMSILAWSCVAWHFIGGLLGTFAGCNYKKCCAFMFWMWWVITMTISFAIGVMVFYFVGFHWCLLGMFTIGMAIGLYFTVKVKKFYNLLKDEASAPAGYSDIYATSV